MSNHFGNLTDAALVEKVRDVVKFCDDCGFASAFVTRDMLAEVADRVEPRPTLLSALKAMDEALTERFADPGSYNAIQQLWGGVTEAWIQIRSAISQADGR